MNTIKKSMLIIAVASSAALGSQDPFKQCESMFCSSNYSGAINCYDRTFPAVGNAQPDILSRALINLGEANLAEGNYPEGWAQRDSRLKLYPTKLSKPWNGSNPEGKTILVRCEGGLGDTFFFLRYVQFLKFFGAKTIVLAQGPLKPLLSYCPYIDQVVTGKDVLPAFDNDVYMMSLPRYIAHDRSRGVARLESTTPATIPSLGQYMYADSTLVQKWKAQLPTNCFKIGICWKASPMPAGVVRTLKRDIPIAMFNAIAQIPGVALFNLLSGFDEPVRKEQATAKTDPLNIVPSNFPQVYSFNDFDKVGPFLDTAAVIANMDLIISVDTSIPNLAGALNKPVWILLPYESDWRWFKAPAAVSPWYPSARLFWQQRQGDWTTVMNTVTNALRQVVNK